MAFATDPKAGFNFTDVVLSAEATSGAKIPHCTIGNVVIGNDGKTYVYAKANASISASTAVCTINAGTFLATASGGSYTSPATALASGDYAWFSKALV